MADYLELFGYTILSRTLNSFTSWFHFSNVSTWLIFIYLANLSCFLGEVLFVTRYTNLSPPVPPSPTALATHYHYCLSPHHPVSCFKAGSCLFIFVSTLPKTMSGTLSVTNRCLLRIEQGSKHTQRERHTPVYNEINSDGRVRFRKKLKLSLS